MQRKILLAVVMIFSVITLSFPSQFCTYAQTTKTSSAKFHAMPNGTTRCSGTIRQQGEKEISTGQGTLIVNGNSVKIKLPNIPDFTIDITGDSTDDFLGEKSYPAKINGVLHLDKRPRITAPGEVSISNGSGFWELTFKWDNRYYFITLFDL